jgi:predicted unusual protein kinase regulating ubiquinone biosynthesis (AarF/ABC1/UbiB family)
MVETRSSATHPLDRRRYRRIILFFARAILHVIWWDLLLARVAGDRVRRTRPDRLRQIARRFRKLAIEMGGVMIKAGQFLSSRVDVLPPEITAELAGLQDEVPAEPIDAIRAVILAELGQPPEALFACFEDQPQAAASLGQTHRARLKPGDGGSSLIVKVQRPGIERLIETDLAALRTVAGWLMLYGPIRRRVNLPALAQEFARTTWAEVDYEAEADHARRFATMFADDPEVCIPAVFPAFSTRRVLTLEDVEHIKITDFAGIERAGISRPRVARKVLDVYLRQIFEAGFFHADPHPGNLFVRPTGRQAAGEDGRPFEVIFVDFGMVGRLPAQSKQQLREILFAVALRDAHRMVRAYQQLGLLLPGADTERVEQATAQVMDRFWGMSVTEMIQMDRAAIGDLALEFRDLLFDLPFQVPQDLVFLGRAVSMLSGLTTALDPDFNPWPPIETYAQGLLADGRRWPGLQAGLATVGEAARMMLGLPVALDTFLRRASEGDLRVRLVADRPLDRQLIRMEKALDRLLWGLVAASSLLAGTLLYVDHHVTLGVAGWTVAGMSLFWAVLTGRGR